ncbi:MAG TPA: stage III sporulation protein AF [Syntrophomonadaceae bacterium]|nr:stage III sporulation protein AF [Syntrophomonadaceae bacterium]
MNTITEIVKNVLVIIIMTGFLELLLPEGGMKPFVRYAIGLFVIVAVLNPILSVLFNQHHLEIAWWDTPPVQQSQDQISKAGQELNTRIGSLSNDDLQKKLEGQVTAVVNLVPGVKEVETQAEMDDKGHVTRLKLKISPDPIHSGEKTASPSLQAADQKMQQEASQVIERKVKDLLKNLYDFQETNIDVIVEGS